MGFTLYDIVKGGTPDYAGMSQAQEQQRQQAITQGTQKINQAFSGFTPSFYQQRAQAYQDFALPQLSQQYQTNRNQIGFGLANRGLLSSSAGTKQWNDLGKAMGQAKQTIADTGIAQSQALQQQVQNQESTLLNQLYQSADPAGAGQQATQTAANYAAPSVYQPLGNLLGSVANQYYLSQLINTYRPTGSSPQVGGPPSYYSGMGGLPNQPAYGY